MFLFETARTVDHQSSDQDMLFFLITVHSELLLMHFCCTVMLDTQPDLTENTNKRLMLISTAADVSVTYCCTSCTVPALNEVMCLAYSAHQ